MGTQKGEAASQKCPHFLYPKHNIGGGALVDFLGCEDFDDGEGPVGDLAEIFEGRRGWSKLPFL